MKPYCRFKHGRMLKTRGKFSKRDGGKRQYYHCRNDYCSYTVVDFSIVEPKPEDMRGMPTNE